jgi:hypothetical protein
MLDPVLMATRRTPAVPELTSAIGYVCAPLTAVATIVEGSLVLKSIVRTLPALATVWLRTGAPLPDGAVIVGGVLSMCKVTVAVTAAPLPGVTVAVNVVSPSVSCVVSTSKK